MIIGAAANTSGMHGALAPLLKMSNATFDKKLEENYYTASGEDPPDALPIASNNKTPTHFLVPPRGAHNEWIGVRMMGSVDTSSGLAVVRLPNGDLSSTPLSQLVLRRPDGKPATCAHPGCTENAIHLNESMCECTAHCTIVNPATQDSLFDPPTADMTMSCHWAGIIEPNSKHANECALEAKRE